MSHFRSSTSVPLVIDAGVAAVDASVAAAERKDVDLRLKGTSKMAVRRRRKRQRDDETVDAIDGESTTTTDAVNS